MKKTPPRYVKVKPLRRKPKKNKSAVRKIYPTQIKKFPVTGKLENIQNIIENIYDFCAENDFLKQNTKSANHEKIK